MIERMQEPDLPDAVKRNVVRILQFVDVPKPLLGTVVSLCFEYINSYNIPVAVRGFAMTVLANAAEREPALKRELKTSLALLLPAASGGILARARRVMKRLEKMDKRASVSQLRKKLYGAPKSSTGGRDRNGST